MVDSKKAAKLKLISDVKEYCRNHSIKSAVRCFHICRNTVRNYIRNEFEELIYKNISHEENFSMGY